MSARDAFLVLDFGSPSIGPCYRSLWFCLSRPPNTESWVSPRVACGLKPLWSQALLSPCRQLCSSAALEEMTNPPALWNRKFEDGRLCPRAAGFSLLLSLWQTRVRRGFSFLPPEWLTGKTQFRTCSGDGLESMLRIW